MPADQVTPDIAHVDRGLGKPLDALLLFRLVSFDIVGSSYLVPRGSHNAAVHALLARHEGVYWQEPSDDGVEVDHGVRGAQLQFRDCTEHHRGEYGDEGSFSCHPKEWEV